jgi:hypothetical protein
MALRLIVNWQRRRDPVLAGAGQQLVIARR